MGQSSSIQEDKMKKRIRQTMGTFMDFGAHLANANEWARLCPTPKTCFLAFRIVVDPGVAPEVLPYVWRIPGNVSVEVRKMRRREDGELSPRGRRGGELDAEETIGQAKTLTVRQFYYIYCFLSDIKACAAVRFPDKSTSPDNVDPDFDETECQICMDKRKEVMLPCTHSFCLYCFQHWSAQSQTCPICRAKIDCSEGDELWQLTSNEIDDIDSYATDLVARIYEYLDKRDKSEHSEADIKRSAEVYVAALAVKQTHFHKLVHTELFPTALPLGFPSILRHGIRLGSEFDTDIMLALELASGEDQHAALQYFQQLRRDQVLAMAMAVEAEADGVDVGLGAFEP